jgi:hypothetical protein
MNIKSLNGWKRLWVVVSITWISVLSYDVVTKLEYFDGSIEVILETLEWLLLPPIALYCFGWGLAWAIKGFRQK